MKSVSLHKILFAAAFSFFIMAFAQQAVAQMPTINTSVNKKSILIGEQIQYRVEATVPSSQYQVAWFTVPDSLGNFLVAAKDAPDTLQKDGMIHYGQTLVITSFDSGTQVIPPLAIRLSSNFGDSSFDMRSDSVEVEVGWAPIDSIMPFHDIKGILPVAKESKWWLWAIGAILVLLLIYFLFRDKFKKKKGVFSEAKLPAYDEAMLALKELSEARLPEKNELKVFHSGLSDIFKRYLARKTNLSKMNLTTDELLLDLQKYPITRERLSTFAECLRMGNAVKFAKYIPPLNENQNCLEQTREMIEQLHSLEGKNTEDDL